jgi:hypothetical protein
VFLAVGATAMGALILVLALCATAFEVVAAIVAVGAVLYCVVWQCLLVNAATPAWLAGHAGGVVILVRKSILRHGSCPTGEFECFEDQGSTKHPPDCPSRPVLPDACLARTRMFLVTRPARPFCSGDFLNRFAPRGTLTATCRLVNGRTMRVSSSHMDRGASTARVAQTDQLLDIAGRGAAADGWFSVIGVDLNDRECLHTRVCTLAIAASKGPFPCMTISDSDQSDSVLSSVIVV